MNENHLMDKQSMKTRFSKLFERMLYYIPALISAFLILCQLILNDVFTIPVLWNRVFFSFILLILSSTGIIAIWRKEIPGLIPGRFIQGKIAVISGIFEFALLLIMSVWFFIFSFSE